MLAMAKRVVLLRAPKGAEDPYALALSRAGYQVHFVPVLHFEFRNEEELSSALLSSVKHSGLILTSQNAVDSCVHALTRNSQDWQHRFIAEWSTLPTFVVGKATAQAAETKLGLKPTGALSGNAEALSHTIIEYFGVQDRTSLKERPLLFPCGAMKRETLPATLQEAGMGLHCVTCYETVAHSKTMANLRTLVETKVLEDSCWVVWFSPSGVQFALESLKSVCAIEQLKFAAIGPTTSEALRIAGVSPVAVSSKPDSSSLVETIMNYA